MTYYVDYKNGKDSFKGTEPTRPLKTLLKAYSKCNSGDNVYCLTDIDYPITWNSLNVLSKMLEKSRIKFGAVIPIKKNSKLSKIMGLSE
jgi:hypothetical protein